MAQLSLIPVSQDELNLATFDREEIEQAIEEAELNFDEVKKSHKEHIAGLKDQLKEKREIIRRAKAEKYDGVNGAQMAALEAQLRERRE